VVARRTGVESTSIDHEEFFTCMAPLSEELLAVLKATPLWETAVKKEPRLADQPYDDRGGSFGRNYLKST